MVDGSALETCLTTTTTIEEDSFVPTKIVARKRGLYCAHAIRTSARRNWKIPASKKQSIAASWEIPVSRIEKPWTQVQQTGKNIVTETVDSYIMNRMRHFHSITILLSVVVPYLFSILFFLSLSGHRYDTISSRFGRSL
ncbi:uncharacterized protein LOC112494417 [Cephus cinctus]|uniref:Uncharacterized protein LOC112494417 n=1 Tax=Cephus cinctus TaxID=211228 RepID=A0AAJ7RI13_CEPCN|nr:uncharacterized protein LOC112494417 [Cephus cinctus]